RACPSANVDGEHRRVLQKLKHLWALRKEREMKHQPSPSERLPAPKGTIAYFFDDTTVCPRVRERVETNAPETRAPVRIGKFTEFFQTPKQRGLARTLLQYALVASETKSSYKMQVYVGLC
ncbi:unnamed protein product, partial [Ectocarpus sp. 13 AM-2016]